MKSKTILDALAEAYTDQRDQIADSDLDDEQPVSVMVTLTLGEWRKCKRMQANRDFAKNALGG